MRDPRVPKTVGSSDPHSAAASGSRSSAGPSQVLHMYSLHKLSNCYIRSRAARRHTAFQLTSRKWYISRSASTHREAENVHTARLQSDDTTPSNKYQHVLANGEVASNATKKQKATKGCCPSWHRNAPQTYSMCYPTTQGKVPRRQPWLRQLRLDAMRLSLTASQIVDLERIPA
jgi:hypothetical protein